MLKSCAEFSQFMSWNNAHPSSQNHDKPWQLPAHIKDGPWHWRVQCGWMWNLGLLWKMEPEKFGAGAWTCCGRCEFWWNLWEFGDRGKHSLSTGIYGLSTGIYGLSTKIDAPENCVALGELQNAACFTMWLSRQLRNADGRKDAIWWLDKHNQLSKSCSIIRSRAHQCGNTARKCWSSAAVMCQFLPTSAYFRCCSFTSRLATR